MFTPTSEPLLLQMDNEDVTTLRVILQFVCARVLMSLQCSYHPQTTHVPFLMTNGPKIKAKKQPEREIHEQRWNNVY